MGEVVGKKRHAYGVRWQPAAGEAACSPKELGAKVGLVSVVGWWVAGGTYHYDPRLLAVAAVAGSCNRPMAALQKAANGQQLSLNASTQPMAA
jgi:hypothetical protein